MLNPRISSGSSSSSPRKWSRRRARGRPSTRCACHAVADDCCPDRLRGVIDAGATRLGLHATGGGGRAASPAMIDHTLLKPDATRAEIEKLCREAAEFHFATVCVNPAWVARVGAAAARHRRRRLLGRRVSARRDHRRRQALRDPAGDLRRRDRDRHGHQHRRAEVRRPPHGRARHRGGGRAVPAVRRDQQGDHRGGAADRRGEDHGLHAVEGRRARTS